VPRLTR
jgi:catechol 2,3-dioxygenase-like lactoylglutathione lyase family enzyme